MMEPEEAAEGPDISQVNLKLSQLLDDLALLNKDTAVQDDSSRSEDSPLEWDDSRILIDKGFLYKKGKGSGIVGRKNWKRRWFVLDTRDTHLLYYYGKETDATPKGQVPLVGAEVRTVENVSHRNQHVTAFEFEIWHPTERVFHLYTETEEDMNQWIATLDYMCSYTTAKAEVDGQDESKLPAQDSPNRMAGLIRRRLMSPNSRPQLGVLEDDNEEGDTGEEEAWPAHSVEEVGASTGTTKGSGAEFYFVINCFCCSGLDYNFVCVDLAALGSILLPYIFVAKVAI